MQQIDQQVNFLLEIDKLKSVYRKTMVKSDSGRQENTAEHSWHIAMAANVLQQYAPQPVNLSRITLMLLLHDIVEIDAGDTFAFAEVEDLDAQQDKELAALERLFSLLPAPQATEYKALWLEFEQAETNDGRFAKAIDRILPLLLNMNDNGGSWSKHKIKRSQALNRNRLLENFSPALWDYACQQIDLAVEKGWLIEG